MKGGKTLEYYEGDTIVYQGQKLSGIFFLERGQCKFSQNDTVLGYIEANEEEYGCFGEIVC